MNLVYNFKKNAHSQHLTITHFGTAIVKPPPLSLVYKLLKI